MLVVEDNDLHVKLFVDLIEQQGYESLFAKTGQEAIKIAKDEIPDLILMDDLLPGILGLEVVRLLRDDEHTKTIPIIAVFEFFDERIALDVGCDAYVSKPIKPLHFLEMINTFLSKGDHQGGKHNS